MWIFIIAACLPQRLHSLEEFRTSDKPSITRSPDPDCFLSVSELIRYNGYPSEEYHVETADEYILTVHRIPHGRYNGPYKDPRPIVFLQHGLLGDASNWISNLPNNSLGFLLADAGYDVWMGNSRGNTYSSNHKSLNPSDEKFWEFSFHEMGYYDIPAVLDFVMNTTGQQRVYYIGHSQGSAIGFIAFSTWPKLAERIKVFFALGPETTVTFLPNRFLRLLAHMPKPLLHAVFGRKSFFKPSAHLRKRLSWFCMHNPKVCANVVALIFGYNVPNLNISRAEMYAAHAPAGTSVQNGFHWIQVFLKKQFQAYDHGSPEKNVEKYNQMMPPIYKLEDIKIPVALWTGGQDLLVSSKDVATLRSRLSNLIYEKLIPEWEHLDFIWGLDATEVMYVEIIKTMKKYP